jgi:hypothetical protein
VLSYNKFKKRRFLTKKILLLKNSAKRTEIRDLSYLFCQCQQSNSKTKGVSSVEEETPF